MCSKAFLTTWLFLAVLSCAVCEQPKKQWYETAIMYEVYPRSFKDSDNDGVGDLRGIIEKMDYFVELGVESIWVQPFYPSGGVDSGYDIADFVGVDPLFGTMDDFDKLIAEAHNRGIKVILDFVPNHTSEKHDWFKQSCEGVKPYDEYYVWREGIWDDVNRKMYPPNNWKSIFGGDAWYWNGQRQQYYFHQFGSGQPDLNFRSEKVRKEIENSLKFWMDRGVDGWRIDALKHLYEDAEFRDEPYIEGKENGTSYFDLDHIYTIDLDETYEELVRWRELVDSYSVLTGNPRILVVECYTDLDHTMAYYEFKGRKAAHYPFNFGLLATAYRDTNATRFKQMVDQWVDNMPKGAVPNWVYGNHDVIRMANHVGNDMADAYILISLLLPGVAVTYNGDEIGMENAILRFELDWKDQRYKERTPMQWDDSLHAGFSRAYTTWIPVASNYWFLNVEAQQKAEWSHLKIYKAVSKLRKTDTFLYGDLNTYVLNKEWIFCFVRKLQGHDTFIVIANQNSEMESVDLTQIQGLSDTFEVLVPSMNAGYQIGQKITSNRKTKLVLRPKASLVLRQGADVKPVTRPTQSPTDEEPTTMEPYSAGSTSVLNSCLLAFAILSIFYRTMW